MNILVHHVIWQTHISRITVVFIESSLKQVKWIFEAREHNERFFSIFIPLQTLENFHNCINLTRRLNELNLLNTTILNLVVVISNDLWSANTDLPQTNQETQNVSSKQRNA